MTVKTHPAVADYLARTKAALADLPAGEVEEIVDDIGPHLSEVAAELGEEVSVEALSQRLGTPEQYAAELRAAAGYPPAAPGPPAGSRRPAVATARFALWALVLGVLIAFFAGLAFAVLGRSIASLLLLALPLFVAIVLVFTDTVRPSDVDELPESRAGRRAGRRLVKVFPDAMVDYLRALRPAWWGLRVLVVGGVTLVAGVAGGPVYLVPVGAVLVVLLMFGKRARTDRRYRWVVAPANFFAAGLVLTLLAALIAYLTGPRWENLPGEVYAPSMPSNFYGFGPNGQPLPEFYLYDQDGRPVYVFHTSCGRYDAGNAETNRFPQPRVEFDPRTGDCVERTDVPFVIAVPTSAPTTTPPPPSK
ncbi:MAG TPA: hypothetical protein VFV67_00050 [Actinophytocola sp.]|uniref:HAAS signaling domain-containing protein n=1 Tax=Actinophytocola sp. TaxID=1872138 RepID=UPI002DBDF437|nr:hypothetical protein [Actinophytocola sp.]HEU5469014.1 hypothetical protein [Actinophytocola sp.]